jgi:serine/threonine protein kinase
MSTYHACLDGTRMALDLASQPLGRGAQGDVFRVRNLSGVATKIYHPREGVVRADRAKLEAMLASPPQHLTVEVEGVSLMQFAWPTHIVENEQGDCAGLLMPEVPLDRAVTFEAFMSRDSLQQALSADDRSLPRRVTICRNLAAALAELHRQHHYFVDIKPQNIYLFKNTGVVCLIDTDSFAIAGPDGSRFPASVYSAEYIAPELLRDDVPARMVQDDRQDCYALAVLMFRILDNGFHPFQGIPATNTDTSEWNIDHSVLKGYYPHGREPNPASTRPPASTSNLWDTKTRALFDRAFGSNQPGVRPNAAEWRDHFDGLLRQRGVFVKCGQARGNVLHIHFAEAECPECRLESIDSSYADSGARPSVAESSEPEPSSPSPRVSTNPASQPEHSYHGVQGWLLLLCVALTVISPLISIFAILKSYNETSQHFVEFPGLKVTTHVDIFLSLALIMLSIRAGVILWQGRPRAVQTARRYFYLSLGYLVVAVMLPFSAGLPSEVNGAMADEALIQMPQYVFGPVIWLLYLSKSKRVRATFPDSFKKDPNQ